MERVIRKYYRSLFSCLIILSLFLSCKLWQKGTVLNPTVPKAGEELRIEYRPGVRLKNSFLMLRITLKDSIVTNVVPMSKKKELLAYKTLLDTSATLLQFMIEDEDGQRISDNGKMFGVPVASKEGKYSEGAYLKLARYWQADNPAKAKEYAEKELKNFASNWEAYLVLWDTALNEKGKEFVKTEVEKLQKQVPAENPAVLKGVIASAYSTLLEEPEQGVNILKTALKEFPEADFSKAVWSIPFSYIEKETAELLKIATGKTKETLLVMRTSFSEDQESFRKYTEALVKEFPNSLRAPQFALDLIEIQYPYPEKYSQLTNALEQWLSKYPKHSKTFFVKLQLWKYYRERNSEKARTLFNGCLRDTTISGASELNDFAWERAEEGKYLDEAEQLIKRAIELTTVPNLRKQVWWWYREYEENIEDWHRSLGMYYDTYGWVKYKKGEIDQAAKLIEEAVGYYKKADEIDLDVWKRLALLYEKRGEERQKLKEIYLDILTQEEDKTIRTELLSIYKAAAGEKEGFDEYLNSEIEKRLIKGKLNESAPDFQIKDMDENEIKFADLKDKVVVLNFWTTSCSPCKKEIPVLNKLVEEFKDEEKVIFIAISIENKRILEEFLNSKEFKYRICYDGENVLKAYKIRAFPTHVLIGSNGNVQYRHIGSIFDTYKFKKEIKTLL